MILIAVATEKELYPLMGSLAGIHEVETIVTGLGPVAAAAGLTRYLSLHAAKIEAVWNIGVAGAYRNSGVNLLDVCLAKQEVLGDFGICLQGEIADFDPSLKTGDKCFYFNDKLNARCRRVLSRHGFAAKIVNFVTVNCCTGTLQRGEMLQQKFDAGCENMEGAAVAMVCHDFNIPCVAVRCISNIVENRDETKWLLAESIEKLGRVVAILLEDYRKS